MSALLSSRMILWRLGPSVRVGGFFPSGSWAAIPQTSHLANWIYHSSKLNKRFRTLILQKNKTSYSRKCFNVFFEKNIRYVWRKTQNLQTSEWNKKWTFYMFYCNIHVDTLHNYRMFCTVSSIWQERKNNKMCRNPKDKKHLVRPTGPETM
jgi:hypothetical protein